MQTNYQNKAIGLADSTALELEAEARACELHLSNIRPAIERWEAAIPAAEAAVGAAQQALAEHEPVIYRELQATKEGEGQAGFWVDSGDGFWQANHPRAAAAWGRHQQLKAAAAEAGRQVGELVERVKVLRTGEREYAGRLSEVETLQRAHQEREQASLAAVAEPDYRPRLEALRRRILG